MKELPTQQHLKECFDYDPDTGVLSWKVRPRHHFNTERYWKIFNKRFSMKKVETKLRNKSNTYITCGLDGERYVAHRLIWVIVYGYQPNFIDHKDGDGLNNKRLNMRDASRRENNVNKRIGSNNVTGVIGVSWNTINKNWRVRITSFYKEINLGSFNDFFESCCVRKSAEIKYGYHENHGRV